MNSETLFSMALGLHTPWQVKESWRRKFEQSYK